MATLAQLEANRRNAQRSTGPRTPAGKTASSQNALKSGVYAAALLIEGDDPLELDDLARDYAADCRPCGPREQALVDTLVHADWLLRRMRRVETQAWNREFSNDLEFNGQPFNYGRSLAGAFDEIDDAIDRIHRRINSLDRIYHRALAELRLLQAARPADPQPEPDPESEPIPEVPAPIGFVPAITPSAIADPCASVSIRGAKLNPPSST